MQNSKSIAWTLAALASLCPQLACRSREAAPPPAQAPVAATPLARAVEKEPFGRLTIDEMMAKIEAARAGKLQLAILDNNSQERYAQSHLPGARWVNYSELKESDLPVQKDTMLVFYCANEH